VERPFGDLPGGPSMVTDVAVDKQGCVLVLMRRDPLCSAPAASVIQLSADGMRVSDWGEEIADAHMLSVHASGLIYVVDRDAHEIVIFKDGRRVGGLGQRHEPGKPFNHPTDITFMPDGRVVVADGYGNGHVHVFSAEGEHLLTFGEVGTKPGCFLTPHSIWPIGEDHIVVADRENHRLQVFDVDGKLVDVWEGFFRPLAIWGDGGGQLYITDSVPSVTLMSETGTRIGRCRPVLNGAHGIAGDVNSGVLYLAEGNPSRVTRLVPMPD
jgi:peptidylglycine monooxygenase